MSALRIGAVAATLCLLVIVPSASASPSLSANGTSVTAATPNMTTSLTGAAISEPTPANQVFVQVATSVGTLSITDASPQGSLAYGYSAWTNQSSIGFIGTESQVNADLGTLALNAGNNSGQTARVSITAFPYNASANLTYSPTNGHFYQYVSDPGVTWAQAAVNAAGMSYGGQQGYLASIPSAAINDLITSKIPNAENVWFGAYAVDSASTPARTWYWSGGPLAGTAMLQCQNLNTSNNNAGSQDNSECATVGGAFVNWSVGEPNDSGGSSVCTDPLSQAPLGANSTACTDGEHYAVTNWGSYSGLWNDLNNSGGGNASGYVVEYGDQVNGTSTPFTGVGSATSSVHVGTVPGSPSGVTVTIKDTTATVRWSAPASDGGWPITSYTVTASTGQSCTVRAPATSCQVTGLPAGRTVSFTVTATSAGGTSTRSSSSNTVHTQSGTRPTVVGRVDISSRTASNSLARTGALTLSAAGCRAPKGARVTGYSWSAGGRVIGHGRLVRFHPHRVNHSYNVTLTVRASNGTVARATFRVKDVERRIRAVVHFAYNSVALSDAEVVQLRRIARNARRLVGRHPAAIRVALNGYASASVEPFGAQNRSNELRLSRQRTLTTRNRLARLLRGRHVRLIVHWHGGEHPAASNFTLAGQAANRRVTIAITTRRAEIHLIRAR